MFKSTLLKQGLTFALANLKTVKHQAFTLLLFVVLQGIAPVLIIYNTQELINAFLETDSQLTVNLLPTFLIWLLAVSIAVFLNPWTTLLQANISEIMSEKLQLKLMSLISNQSDQSVLEAPDVIDDIHFIKSQIDFRPLNFIMMSANTLKDSMTIIGLVIIMIPIHTFAPLILMSTLIPHAYLSVKTKEREWLTRREHGSDLKAMYYLFNHALDNKTHLERRVFQANRFIIDTHKYTFTKMHEKLRNLRIKTALFPILTLTFALVGVMMTAWLVINQPSGIITPGNIAAVLFSFVMLQQTTESTIRDQVDFTQTLNYFYLLKNLTMKLSGRLQSKHPLGSTSFDRVEKVVFKDVSFAYPDGTQALNNISFTVRKGDKIAIIGKNGSGKSTLVKLLLGSYQPTSGQILINDMPVTEDWARTNHRIVSCMTQDFGKYIFSAKDNIGFGDCVPDSTKSQLPFIKDWDKPLSPILGGFNLSGGQWQQLALQRALLKEKSLHVFDEPTSAIDPVLESHIIDSLVTTPADITLIVTHRLGAVSRVNKILMLDQGTIVAQGSHKDLMATSREYRDIYLSQTRLYKKEVLE